MEQTAAKADDIRYFALFSSYQPVVDGMIGWNLPV